MDWRRSAAAAVAVLASAAPALSAAPVAGGGRPSTLSMSCAQAQSLVRSRGAIVLGTGPRLFDRYVAGPIGFCEQSEYAYRRSVPTADSPACPIGYVCTNEIPPWLMERF